MAQGRVIVVEDEADLRDSICAFLTSSGFDAHGVPGGADLDALWRQEPADILVLDIGLPGEDGLSIARRMRAISNVGIIILTARVQAEDRVSGIECGADNYLVKPVVLRELALTAERLIERLRRNTAGPELEWVFDSIRWRLVAPNGAEVALTSAEFRLLNALALSPGAAVGCEVIMGVADKSAMESHRRSLDSVLSRLRRKVETESGHSLPIKSVRSVGYAFTAPLSRVEAAA